MALQRFASDEYPGDALYSNFVGVQQGAAVCLPKFVQPVQGHINEEYMPFLLEQGVFTIPSNEDLDEFLRCYALFVHPFLHTLDLGQFLGTILTNDDTPRISLLLLRAVIFASSAFVDLSCLKAQGFDSRSAARKALFQLVELLHSLNHENNPESTIQALLLMSYWYERPADPKGPSYWLSRALGLARIIGMDD